MVMWKWTQSTEFFDLTERMWVEIHSALLLIEWYWQLTTKKHLLFDGDTEEKEKFETD